MRRILAKETAGCRVVPAFADTIVTRRGVVRALAAVCTTASMLCGCVNDAGLKTNVAAMTPASDALAQTSAGVTIGAWPQTDWVERYGDRQLDALVNEALQSNPDIQIAKARIAGAQSQLDQFGSLTGLNGTAFAATSRARLPKTSDAANVSVLGQQIPVQLFSNPWVSPSALVGGLSYQLDLWGRNTALTRGLLSQSEAARVDGEQARLTLTVALVTLYCELDRAFGMRDILQQKVRDSDLIDATLKARAARGIDNAYDASDATLKRSKLLAQVELNDERITLARLQLGVLSGRGPEWGLQLRRPRLASLDATVLPASLPLELLGRRPDIVAAKLHAQAALAKADATRAQFYPDINLSAVAGLSALNLGSLFSLASATGTIGPAISLPIFDRTRLHAQLGGDYANVDAAVGLYNKTVNEALGEVARQIASLRTVESLQREQAQAVKAATQIESIAQERHRRGIGMQKDAMLAELALLDERAQQIELDTQRRMLQAALVGALGGGFDERRIVAPSLRDNLTAFPLHGRITDTASHFD